MKAFLAPRLVVVLAFSLYVSLNNACAQFVDPIDTVLYTGIDSDLVDVIYYCFDMPEFPDGSEEMNAYIKKELVYPKKAVEQAVEGVVLVRFVVEIDGSLSHVKVVVPLFPECDKEALRVVKSMPKWKPAIHLGKPVRCFNMVPVYFEIL